MYAIYIFFLYEFQKSDGTKQNTPAPQHSFHAKPHTTHLADRLTL